MTLLRGFTDSEIAVLVPHHAPRIFHVNWFGRDNSGCFLWPGFGESCRVVTGIFRSCDGDADADDTASGRVSAPEPRLSCA
jgi:GTP-dependent phosphoenolpyruvate carboxykinase